MGVTWEKIGGNGIDAIYADVSGSENRMSSKMNSIGSGGV